MIALHHKESYTLQNAESILNGWWVLFGKEEKNVERLSRKILAYLSQKLGTVNGLEAMIHKYLLRLE